MVLSQLLFFNHGYHRYRGFIPIFFLNHAYSHKEKSHRYNCRTIPPVDQLPWSTFATCPSSVVSGWSWGQQHAAATIPPGALWRTGHPTDKLGIDQGKIYILLGGYSKANPSSNLEKPTLTEVKHFSIAMVDYKRVDDPEIILPLGCRLLFLGLIVDYH